MHRVGLAHLDLKPSNVIVRELGRSAADKGSTPVLVDFGLAGRRLRPGCGTANYAAPEVWSAHTGVQRDPRPADVYAFGCLAYELLSGRLLFEGESDRDVVAAHLAHDGAPAAIEAWARTLKLRPLCDWLKRCLRQDPRERAAVDELIEQLRGLEPSLQRLEWPLVPPTTRDQRAR
jgi:serine/threonine protein kinase